MRGCLPLLDDRGVAWMIRNQQPMSRLFIPAKARDVGIVAVQNSGLPAARHRRHVAFPANQAVAAGGKPARQRWGSATFEGILEDGLGEAVDLNENCSRLGYLICRDMAAFQPTDDVAIE